MHTKEKIAIAQRGLCQGTVKSTPVVSWFMSQNFICRNHYNQSILLEVGREIGTTQLETIMYQLIAHHDALRLNYHPRKQEMYYNNEHLNNPYLIPEYILSVLPPSAQSDAMQNMAEQIKGSLDIEKDLLIKACIFITGSLKNKLLITAHHLVVDAVSWRIILEDMANMLKQISLGQPLTLPDKGHSYQEWAIALEYYGSRLLTEELLYWEELLNKDFHFPIEYDLGPDTVSSLQTFSSQLSKQDTGRLMMEANVAYRTEPRDILIASLARTIEQLTGISEIVIELEGHGREDIAEDINVSRTVGWFTSFFPLYISRSSDDLEINIKEVKESIRRIPGNGINFGVLKYLTGAFREEINRNIRFNYLGDFTADYRPGEMELLTEQSDGDIGSDNHLSCLIDINCLVVGSELKVMISSSSNKFSESLMKRFLHIYMDNLTMIINHCCDKKTVEFTLLISIRWILPLRNSRVCLID